MRCERCYDKHSYIEGNTRYKTCPFCQCSYACPREDLRAVGNISYSEFVTLMETDGIYEDDIEDYKWFVSDELRIKESTPLGSELAFYEIQNGRG